MRAPCLLLLTAFLSSAVAETPWSNWGYTVQATRNDGELTIDRVRNPGGSEFEVTHRFDLQSGDVDRINQLHAIFSGWKQVRPRAVSYVVDGVKVDASVLPDAIHWSNRDLKENLPAGLAFSYIGAIAYDFRLLQSNMFVRIQGVYNGEEGLLKKLFDAAENPLLFVRKNDPNYFSDRLSQLEDSAVRQQLEAKSNLDALTARFEAALESARRGAVAYALSGSPKKIDPKLIDAILAAKKAEPTLNLKALSEKFKKENVKASDKEIAAVLALWFNEN